MSKKFFEKLGKEMGKEMDAIVKEGESFLKDLDATIKEETSDKKMAERKDSFHEFVKDIDQEFGTFMDGIKKDIEDVKNESTAKVKTFKIRMHDFDKSNVKFNKKLIRIEITKNGSDKSFNINLTDTVTKKNVSKILNSLSYDEESSIIQITVKKKFLKEG